MPSSPDSNTTYERCSEGHTQSCPELNLCNWLVSNTKLRLFILFVTWVSILILFTETVAAGNGMTLSKQSRDTLAIPRWLYLATGGATIGASALLTSFVTDRAFIRYLHNWSLPGPRVNDWWTPLVWVGRGLGILVLGLAIYLGVTGPQLPTASFTILVTFVVVRAGLPMLTYLGGNLWPVLNPWRGIVSLLPTGYRTYPEELARWPAVGGLLLLVWLEVIFPVSTIPTALSIAILGYSAVTIAGAVLVGPDAWFENADPISVLFRFFGAVAPVKRRDGKLTVKLPGSDLTDSDLITDTSDVAFVIALIWELTYSGFITTGTGAATIETLVSLSNIGVGAVQTRAILIYTLLFVSGYVVFFGAYWYAGALSRRRTETYITAKRIAFRFAPSLLAIAAGYHLAHYTGLAVSLSPALWMAIVSPLSPPANPLTLSPPGWFEGLSIAYVLVGHLLAIWAAHATAYELFSSRLVAIRSQYPFVVVMIGYTVISLWILSLPGATPPYLP
ncbi:MULTISPECIES: hypothetical protein [unclassified Haloferax]|uniref:hypothetical protein n=1 Tax=unclassified Haloferax TaxID=2625095 RepID=UPI0028755F02|nr:MULTISPECIES: hypothetical protein [unclassified Haloferax]MDS0243896.1 hypothetical protein [Haloferax sp. S2CR25]MDS0447017.1 hypothetical protein [Haloferax sp. S2CR25-2]